MQFQAIWYDFYIIVMMGTVSESNLQTKRMDLKLYLKIGRLVRLHQIYPEK